MMRGFILLPPNGDHFPYLETPESLISVDICSLNKTAVNILQCKI